MERRKQRTKRKTTSVSRARVPHFYSFRFTQGPQGRWSFRPRGPAGNGTGAAERHLRPGGRLGLSQRETRRPNCGGTETPACHPAPEVKVAAGRGFPPPAGAAPRTPRAPRNAGSRRGPRAAGGRGGHRLSLTFRVTSVADI
ncbi:translation initiation factor IF-2-like [Lemur catta]|uniref:translation initiation factor IF-2-like n=1 Tax=Lemur catta TaxID=9447 RepID=UPI001E26D5DA|nr:translation initiation factor IF-2-like [Lemur catta]